MHVTRRTLQQPRIIALASAFSRIPLCLLSSPSLSHSMSTTADPSSSNGHSSSAAPRKPGIPTISHIYDPSTSHVYNPSTSATSASASASISPSSPTSFPFPLHGGTIDTHLDAGIEPTADIAPPLHPSTTFVQASPHSTGLIYSRVHAVTRTRVEAILGHYDGGHATTYASGLAAAAALIHAIKPRRIYSEAGYHGVQAALAFWKQRQVGGGPGVEFVTEEEARAMMKEPKRTLPPSVWGAEDGDEGGEKGEGLEGEERVLDLIWLEAPNNPYATLADLAYWAGLARHTGALVVVDSTLATPLGMLPLQHGVDVVMHASTKYFSGHSDLLGGVLTTPHARLHAQLQAERVIDGAVMGSLETWLLLRSLRTFHLRVHKQCSSVMPIVHWLEQQRTSGANIVTAVHHPCLPSHPSYALSQAYLTLPPATFAFELAGGKEGALKFASHLCLFRLATSLGGIESLVDWRFQYDTTCPEGLLRMSIGVEEPEDLLADLKQAMAKM